MAEKSGGAAKVSSADMAPPSLITPAVTYVACSDHPEEMMVNFCKTCKLFVCGVCLDEKHESHICSSAKKQLILMEQEIESHLNKLKRISGEQNTTVQEVKASRDQETQDLADGLKAREQQETDATAQLDRQKSALIARVENAFEKRKVEIREIMSDSKSKLQTAQDERIAALDATAAKMSSRCTQLQNVIRKCEQIVAFDTLSQPDFYQLLPEIQEEVVLPVERTFSSFEPTEPLPSIDIERNADEGYLLPVLKGTKFFQSYLAGLAPGKESDENSVVVRKTFWDQLSKRGSELRGKLETLKPDEACQKEDLVPVSAPSADSLVALLGDSVALRKEDQGNGKKVLKQGQAGPVTHVLSTVKERTDGAFHATYYAYLPINTPVNTAVEQALDIKISKAQEHKGTFGFSGAPVQTKIVREWFQSSRHGCLDVWK